MSSTGSRHRWRFTVLAPSLTAVLLGVAPPGAIGGATPAAAATVQPVQPRMPTAPTALSGAVVDHRGGASPDRHHDRRHHCERRRGGLLGLLARLLFGSHRHC